MRTLRESILKDMEDVMQSGDDFVKHQKAMEKEWRILKRIKISDFEEWVKHDDTDVVQRYVWKCPAIITEYFNEFTDKKIATIDIYICCEMYNANNGYFEITICPIDKNDIGVTEEVSIFYKECKFNTLSLDFLFECGIKEIQNKNFRKTIEKGLLKLQQYKR